MFTSYKTNLKAWRRRAVVFVQQVCIPGHIKSSFQLNSKICYKIGTVAIDIDWNLYSLNDYVYYVIL